jgi:hypothetical protein
MKLTGSDVHRTGNALLKLFLPLVMLTLLLQVWLFHPLVVDYFPTLDEIAMQAASGGAGGGVDAWAWFTQGLHGYFVPYPEWDLSAPDLWRPLLNCWYWLNQQLSGDHWGNQLLFGYLAHALVVGVVCYLCYGVLGLNTVMLWAAVAIAMLNPAYVFHSVNDPFSIPRATQFPIYQVEVIDALLMLVAVLIFLKRRFWEFSLIATAAVMFKETALALPVSAAVLVLAWRDGDARRSPASLSWLVLPMAVWVLGRTVAFFHGATHLLPPGASAAWLFKPVRNLLFWPTGLNQQTLGVIHTALSMHDWSVLGNVAAVCMNLAWWAALLTAVTAGYRLWQRRRLGAAPEPWMVLLVFALGNLVWVMLLPATELRYGYLWFALGPPAMFALLSRYRWGNAAALLLTVGLLVPQVYSLAQSFSDAPLEAYRTAKQSARALTAQMAQLPAQVKTVYLLDDMAVQSSSPQYFARFAQFSGAVVLVNNLAPIRGCSAAAQSPASQRYRLTRAGAAIDLAYEAPQCFQRAWNVAPADQIDSSRFIQRGKLMRYHFPELQPGKLPPWVDRFDYDPGRHWSVRVSDPGCAQPAACAWLGFNPAQHGYELLSVD